MKTLSPDPAAGDPATGILDARSPGLQAGLVKGAETSALEGPHGAWH